MLYDNIKSFIHETSSIQKAQFQTSDKYYSSALELENFINVRNGRGEEKDPFFLFNDPITTGFKLFFHFDVQSGLLADENYVDSALAYFKRIGDNERYVLCKTFINLLHKISTNAEWIFQSIEGVDDIFTSPLQGLAREHKLDIKTLETLDTKIMQLIMIYRQIIFDQTRGVEVLPINLRRFSCSLYIYDRRVFAKTSSATVNYLRTYDNNDVTKLNHILIDMGMCEFSLESGKDFVSDVSNIKSEFNTNNLVFTTKQVMFSNLLMHVDPIDAQILEDYARGFTTKQTDIQRYIGDASIRDRLLNYVSESAIVRGTANTYDSLTSLDAWKTSIKNIGVRGAKSVIDLAMRKATKMYLGNVYGFGFDDVAMAGRSGNPLAIASMHRINDSTTRTLIPRTPKRLGNVND